jgi:hypothetical protein
VNLRAPTLILAFIAAAAAAAGAPPQQGQETPDTTTVTLDRPGKPETAAPAPGADRPASHSISAIISSGLPAYSPKDTQPKKEPAEDVKAKNDMPRLPLEVMPRFIVRDKKVPEFSELELYTRKGLTDLAFQRNPWLHLFNFFGLKRNFAYAWLRDQEIDSERSELAQEAVDLAGVGDAEDAKDMQQAIIDEHFETNFEDSGGGGPVR